jgi:hypothetical protein
MQMPVSEQNLPAFKTWLKDCLAFGPVTVTFTKRDGSERVMECTTNPALVPIDVTEEIHYTNTDNPIDFPAPKKERKVNEDVVPVYDLESKAWKSFRWDSVKQINIKI